jgi:hypothetical protein
MATSTADALDALAVWLRDEFRSSTPPDPVELWRLRSPRSGVDLICTAKAIAHVGLEVRVDRAHEFYQSIIFKTLEEAQTKIFAWRAIFVDKGWQSLQE